MLALLCASSAAHGDETGWRIEVRSAGPWVLTDARVTVYAILRSQGHKLVLEILGRQLSGV